MYNLIGKNDYKETILEIKDLKEEELSDIINIITKNESIKFFRLVRNKNE